MEDFHTSPNGVQSHARNGYSAPAQGHPNGHNTALARLQSEAYCPPSRFLSGELAEDHRAMLEGESSLSPEAINRRGYFTCAEGDKATLKYLGFPANLGRCLIIPAHNWRGERAGFVARPDIPITGRDGKKRKYLLPSGEPPVLDASLLACEHMDDPTRPLIITEGAKKADAAASRGLASINLNGVFGFRGTNAKGGLTALPDWENIALKGRAVYIAYDSDVSEKAEVESALRRLSAFLQARGAVVKRVDLQPGPRGEKTGLDDFFARGGTGEDVLALGRDLAPLEENRRKARARRSTQVLEALGRDGRPIIEINDRQLGAKIEDLAAAFERWNTGTPTLFHGASGMVLIERDKDGAAGLAPVSREALQVLAAKAAHWTSTSEHEGVRSVPPPRDLCANFLAARFEWRGIPALDGIASAPFFDATGALCDRMGYQVGARTWLALAPGFELPDTTPTPANVTAAKRLILDSLLGEVAFADQASRAGAVALMLLPFVRRLIPGQTPLHLFDAPTQSSGKTYAASLCLAPFCEVVPTTEKKDAEENRKSLFAHLASGAATVFIDNVRGSLDDPTIAAAITTGKLQGRLIGTGQNITLDTRAVWVATSNNAQLEPDAASRAIVIRLDTNEERPEARNYRGDPLAFLKHNRAQAIAALLTLARAWQAAGSPLQAGPCRSRFKQWEQVLGGILEAIGIPSFLDNLSETREAVDSQGSAWRELVGAWHKAHGAGFVPASELVEVAQKCEDFAALLGEKENKAARLGRLLQAKRDKVFAGFKITRSVNQPKGSALWRLKPLESGGSGGSGGSSSTSTREADFQTVAIKEEEISTSRIEVAPSPPSPPSPPPQVLEAEVEVSL